MLIKIFYFAEFIGSVPYTAHNYGFGTQSNTVCGNNSTITCLPTRAVHERSHSDGTTAPLPSVDLSMESSSVTSLSNLSLRKHPITGIINNLYCTISFVIFFVCEGIEAFSIIECFQ